MSNHSKRIRLARHDKLLGRIHASRKLDIARQQSKKWGLLRQSEELDATDNSTDAITYLDRRLACRTSLAVDIADASGEINLLERAAKMLELARDKTQDAIVQLQREIDAAEANDLLQEFVARSFAAIRQAPDKS